MIVLYTLWLVSTIATTETPIANDMEMHQCVGLAIGQAHRYADYVGMQLVCRPQETIMTPRRPVVEKAA